MRGHSPTLDEKVAFLRDPRAFGGEAGSVRAIETHFAWVFLTRRDAYKLKKPLRHRQMDYRALAARERGCREELRLNRRMAGRIYYSVLPLRYSEGALSIGGSRGVIVDWLIHMKRLPEAGLLDVALGRRSVASREIDRVATRLARFYRGARSLRVPGSEYTTRFARQVRENRQVICSYGERLPQALADQVARLQLQALRSLGPALAARGAHIVDGHGDLRAEHVCLGPTVAIIDALEFDPALRRLDPAEELALLALEIERLGRPDLAQRLFRRFCAEARDPVPPQVFAFYKSHRAATRAKLAAWHLDDPQFPDPRPWVARTKSLLMDALRYAREACR